MQRVEVLSGAELAHFVHPVSGECGRAHHQRWHGAAVWSFGPGILPRPERTVNRKKQRSITLACNSAALDSFSYRVFYWLVVDCAHCSCLLQR